MNGLRFRLTLIVLLAALPMAGLIVYNAFEQRSWVTLHNQRELLRLVQHGAADYRKAIQQTRQLLNTLSNYPAINQRDAAASSGLFSKVLQEDSLYANIFATTPDGAIFASALPTRGPNNVSDRTYFQHVIQSRGFALGELVIGHTIGKPTLHCAYPVLDITGQIQAVVVAALDLSRLFNGLSVADLPIGHSLTIIDDQGKILFRHPDPDAWVGKPVSAAENIKLVMTQRQGVGTAKGLDGLLKLYAFMPLEGIPTPGFIYAGIPTNKLYAPVDQMLYRNLLLLGAATTVMLLFAWWFGHFFVTRYLAILTNTTRQLSLGDLSARTGLMYGKGEIDQLAQAFDQMAASLQEKEVERQRADDNLKKEKELSDLLLNTIPHPAFLVTAGKKILALNQTARDLGAQEGDYCWCGFQKLTGISTEQREYFAKHGKPAAGIRCFFCLADAALPAGQSQHAEVAALGRTWDVWWVPINHHTFLHYAIDITVHKEAEEALRLERNKLKSILNAMEDGVYIVSPTYEIEYINPVIEKEFGKVLGRKCYEYLHCRTEACPWCKNEEVFSGRSVNWEWHAARTGKTYHLFCTCLKNPDGTLSKLEIYHDITNFKQAEESIRRLSQKNQLILEAAGEGIVGIDLQGKIYFINPAAATMTGYEITELIGQDLHQRIHHSKSDGTPYALSECPMHISIVEGTYSRVRDEILWRKNGTSFPAAYSSTPIMEEQNIVGAVVVFRDISQRKQAEAEKAKLESQLHQAQKLEAIGTLAGGIAHDFNNILMAILGYTELASINLSEDSRAHSQLEEVLKAGNRARDLVQQILAFSRQGEGEQKPVKMGPIIQEALKMLHSTLPTTIEIRQHIDNEGIVLADPIQIHQIIINLCTNAYHAMRDKGGVLEVSLTSVTLDSSTSKLILDLSSGLYLQLSVSDTGGGIDPAILERIFEPFFTTKGPGEGTGLGLSVVHGIVQKHGGAIKVYSEPDKGTVFHIFLPQVVGDAVISTAEEDYLNLPRGTEHILVIDDEEVLTILISSMLESLGYAVTTCTSSISALNLFQTNPDDYDLILTDQTMPKMTGMELSQQILQIRPDIPIILSTGFSYGVSLETTQAAGIQELLQKPIIKKDLAEKIRQILDSH